jgi:PAS domain S-box-containing protein
MERYLGFLRGSKKPKSPKLESTALAAVDATLAQTHENNKRVLQAATALNVALSQHYTAAVEGEIGGSQLTTRGLLSGLSDPVLVVRNDEGSVVELYNDAAAKVFGYAPSEVIGNTLTLLFPRDKNFKKVLKSALTFSSAPFEVQGKTKDNRVLVLEAQASRYSDTTVYVLRDLTARRAAEQKEREATRRRHELQSIVDSLDTVGVFVTDPNLPDNPIIFCNAGASAITEYPKAELMGRNPRFLQAQDLHQPAAQQIRQALQRLEPFQTVVRNYKKTGGLYFAMLSLKPVFAKREGIKTLSHWVGIFVDVSERNHQARTVSQLDLYLTEIILRSPIGITVYDATKATDSDDYLFFNAQGRDVARTYRNALFDSLLFSRLKAQKTVVDAITLPEDQGSKLYTVTHCLLDGQRVLSLFVDATPDDAPPLAAAVDSFGAAMLLLDPATKTVQHANYEALRLFENCTPGTAYEALAARAPLGLQGQPVQYALLRKGDTLHIAVECTATHPEGAVLAVVVLPHDDLLDFLRPRTSEALDLSALPAAAVVMDQDGFVTLANTHAKAYLGLDKGSAVNYVFGQTPLELLKTPAVGNYHVTASLSSGQSLNCTVLATPFADGSTLLLILDGLMSQADSLSQALYNTTTPVAVLACQPGLPLVMANAAFFEHYKALPNEFLSEFFVLSSRNELPFDAAHFKMGASWAGTLATLTKSGGVLTAQTSAVPLVAKDQQTTHVLLTQQQVVLEA